MGGSIRGDGVGEAGMGSSLLAREMRIGSSWVPLWVQVWFVGVAGVWSGLNATLRSISPTTLNRYKFGLVMV